MNAAQGFLTEMHTAMNLRQADHQLNRGKRPEDTMHDVNAMVAADERRGVRAAKRLKAKNARSLKSEA